MNELALFAGVGGGLLGSRLLGWRTVCAVEIEPYCRRVLMQRQNDGLLDPFPIWDDVRTFDGLAWRGKVDVVTGGFPCQDISAAGKGAGIEGARSGLWSEMARIIGEVRPRYALVENSPVLTCRGLDRVLGDLAAMGFDAKWGVIGAQDAIWAHGTPAFYHARERIWIVADSQLSARKVPAPHGFSPDGKSNGPSGNELGRAVNPGGIRCDTDIARLAQRQGKRSDDGEEQPTIIGTDWWLVEPELGRVAHGVAHRMDRLRAIGNGQVPAVVRAAWELLTQDLFTAANLERQG